MELSFSSRYKPMHMDILHVPLYWSFGEEAQKGTTKKMCNIIVRNLKEHLM